MSLQQPSGDETIPACHVDNGGETHGVGEWRTAPADAYPKGYPRMCQRDACFGTIEGERDGDGRMPEFDHTDAVETFVRATGGSGTGRRLHRPVGVDADE